MNDSPTPPGLLDRSFAATQAATIAAILMVLWDGLAATAASQSFWTVPNLMAGLFYGRGSLRPDFGYFTLAGMSIHLLSCIGFALIFSLLVPPALRTLTTLLLGIVAATTWFYLLDGFLWRRAFTPFAIYSRRPAIFFSFVLLGICVGLYSVFVRSSVERQISV